MATRFLFLVIYLVLFINGTLSHFFKPPIESTQLQETYGVWIKAEKRIAFTSPIVPFKLHYYSKRNSHKYRVEVGTNKTAVKEETENKLKENSVEFQSKLSKTEKHMFGGVLLLLGMLSLLGNGCTFILFFSQKKDLSPVEILIVHLAIVDVMSTLASYPLPIMAAFRHEWHFGDTACTFHAFISEFLTASSVFSITLIAVFRCLKTCILSLGIRVTCWTSYKGIFGGNVISFLWAATPLVGIGNYNVEPFGLECAVNWIARETGSRSRIVLEAVFGVFIPLAIILLCYFNIIKTVHRSKAQLRSTQFRRRNRRFTAAQFTCNGILVALCFAITRIPITITLLLCSFRGELNTPNWITLISVILAKSSVALNPLIYVFITKRYRMRLSEVVYKWIKTAHGTQHYVTFNKKDYSEDVKSTSECDVNGKIIIRIYINSSGTHKIYRRAKAVECKNEEGFMV